MFSIYENNKKNGGGCRSFVLCLDYVAISPFTYFKDESCIFQLINDVNDRNVVSLHILKESFKQM